MRYLIVLVGGLLAGCSSGLKEASFAIHDGKDKVHYIVNRSLVNDRFTVTQPHTSGQFHCTRKYTSERMAELRQLYGEHTWFEDCTPLKQMAQHDYNLTADQSNASLVQGPVSAAILSAGVAFAGHQIGRGLKGSGDTVNQNGGGASASSESESSSGASAMNNSGNRTTNIKPSTTINSNNVIKNH